MWDQLRLTDIVLAAAVFVLVMALWAIALLYWHLKRKKRSDLIQDRLGLGKSAHGMRELKLWHDGKEATTLVPGLEPKLSLDERLDRVRKDAGWDTPAQTLISTGLLVSIALFGAAFLASSSLLLAIGILVAFALAAKTYYDRCVLKQQELFETQLVDGLELAARSLRAGHPLLASFRVISEEIPDPVGGVFNKVCQQQGMGVSLEEALRQVAGESNREDLKLFATSVVIQLRSGGNLADMMTRLATVIRERMKLSRHVRILTAQTQFSKMLLLSIPFILFMVISLVNPDYMAPLYTRFVGKILLVAGAVGMIFGAWLMKRLSQLKY